VGSQAGSFSDGRHSKRVCSAKLFVGFCEEHQRAVVNRRQPNKPALFRSLRWESIEGEKP